jgi:hypothetical protein
MYSKKFVIPGIILLLIIIFSPYWYNASTIGLGVAVPELQKPEGENCVEDKEWMRVNHMELLKDWRDDVVRKGDRTQYNGFNKTFEDCFNCHRSYEEFCMKCHGYLGVTPGCVQCHIYPELVEQYE